MERVDYHRNHLREITGPSEAELASGVPINFIVGGLYPAYTEIGGTSVGGWFPDVPSTRGRYHPGDKWGQGKFDKTNRYAGWRDDASPANVSGIDDDEAYLLNRMGTEWDIGGRGKGMNANRFISRSAGSFGVRSGFRAGMSLDSYGVPVGAIGSGSGYGWDPDDDDDDNQMVDLSWTGAGKGRGYSPRGNYGIALGSFTRREGIRGSFLDSNPAQTGALGSGHGWDDSDDDGDNQMVDLSWTGAGKGRGYNPRGQYGIALGSFTRREGIRGSFLDSNPAQTGALQSSEEREAREEIRAQRRNIKIEDAAEDIKDWASENLIPVGDRFVSSDASAFGYTLELLSKNDQAQAAAEAQKIARRHNTQYTIVGREEGWNVDAGVFVVIFSDAADAVVVAPGEFSVTGMPMFSAQTGALFKKLRDTLVGDPKSVDGLKKKLSRLKKQLKATEAELAEAQAQESGGEKEASEGMISIGNVGGPFGKRASRQAEVQRELPIGQKRSLAIVSRDDDDDDDDKDVGTKPLSKILSEGSKGPQVVALQSSLNELYGMPREIDGDFGPDTENVVKAFQRREGLDDDGEVGPNTLRVLGKRLSEKGYPLPRELAAMLEVSGLVSIGRLAGSGLPFDGVGSGRGGRRRASADDLTARGWAPVVTYGDTSPVRLDEDDEDEPSSVPASGPVLRFGSSGPRVETLQRALVNLDYGDIEIDGDFGAVTKKAVIAFQKGANLTPDGEVGPRTREAIHRLAPRFPTVGSMVGDLVSIGSVDDLLVDGSGLIFIGDVGSVFSSKKKRAANKKKRQTRRAGRKAARKETRDARKGKRKKFGQKGFMKQTKGWLKRGLRTKGKKEALKKRGLGRFGALKGKGGSTTRTRPPGSQPSRATPGQPSRAAPGGYRTPPGAPPVDPSLTQVPPMPGMDQMPPMEPPPGMEGGGGGAPMGGGGGGGEPPGGGGGGGGEPPPEEDFGGDEEGEEDEGFEVLDFGDEPEEEEEEEDPSIIVLPYGGEQSEEGEEGEEGEEEAPRGRGGFGPSIFMKRPGAHGRQIGVNPMGQPIYESGRIVIGSVEVSDAEVPYTEVEQPSRRRSSWKERFLKRRAQF